MDIITRKSGRRDTYNVIEQHKTTKKMNNKDPH